MTAAVRDPNNLADLVRRPTVARHGWATHGIVMVVTDAGDLVPEVPGQLYAGVATWRTRTTWLRALGAHPRTVEAARRHQTCPATLGRVAAAAADYAHPATGRGIAVAHGTIAKQLGVCNKTVQRCFWALEELGLVVRILDGSDMTLDMRMKVRDHYRHGHKRGTRSKLPNVYAATVPRWVAAKLTQPPKPGRGSSYACASVDNPLRRTTVKPVNVHPPVGGTPTPQPDLPSYLRTKTIGTTCGQTGGSKQKDDRTAAPRPTKAHQRTECEHHTRRLDPALERFARALRSELLGFRGVSLYRICPALSLYVSAGLIVSDLCRGLTNYLEATGRTWLTSWQPHQGELQARYLVGMLTRARLAGYIALPDPDDPYDGVY